MWKISLKVENDNNFLKYGKHLRSFTKLGLSELTSRIENDEPVFECVLFENEEETANLEKLITSLSSEGAKVTIYQSNDSSNEKISLTYLRNRIERFRQIQEQNQRLDDLMHGNDE
ncbi:hypothetical protein HOO54_10580 [Bacillus sp. WMMC1349]|uniref:hypothetical protein n=1 Tax=Bacillus sp. WMMC1349 TaxID=2736254 RepID=UPI001556A3B0|nr:hypothetical protein [Bacillus sp. WMMC1349]NPC92662.1 hypothetical protein [Bacillus sp. WMMC1349]